MSWTLGVNGWRLLGQRTGVGRYTLNIVRNWTRDVAGEGLDRIDLYTPAKIDRDELGLPEMVRDRVLRPNMRMLVWENLRFGPSAKNDVLWCPSFSRPLISRGKTVVTMHEATLRLYPHLYPRSARVFHSQLYGWSARHATLLITHTEASKADIIKGYGVAPERIRVVPLAPSEEFNSAADEASRQRVEFAYLGASVPFFLHVGKLTTRRNVPKLIEAFGRWKRSDSAPHKLVVIGLNNLKLDVAALAAQHGVDQDLVYREYVSDEDLAALYAAAQAFVLPYTYEAVALTALEAQASGTPVVITGTPGLREMTGGAALYLSEAAVGPIAEALSRISSDNGLRRKIVEKSLEHVQQLSWQRTASETLAVLEEAAHQEAPSSNPQPRQRPA